MKSARLRFHLSSLAFCLSGVCFLAPQSAQALHPRLADAREALAARVPFVATQKVRALQKEVLLSGEDSLEAARILAEALLTQDQAADGLAALREAGGDRDPASALLYANLLAACGEWEGALASYQTAARLSDAAVPARIGEAEALHALGRLPEAAATMEKVIASGGGSVATRLRHVIYLLDLHQTDQAAEMLALIAANAPEERKWRTYVEGRLMLQINQADPALALFRSVLERREFVPESLFLAATFGASEARIALEGYERADKELKTFVHNFPNSPHLERAFRRMDLISAEQENPAEEEYHLWARKPEQGRAALALFYLARMQWREKKQEKTLISLNTFLSRFRGHPREARAHVLRSEVQIAAGRRAEAIKDLEAAMRKVGRDDELRAEIELRIGLLHYAEGESLLAANLFASAASHAAAMTEVAAFDAALAWLHQGNFDRFSDEFRRLATVAPQSTLFADLELEKGLEQARRGLPVAVDSLERFLARYPGSARIAEARLAMVETAFASGSGPADAPSLQPAALYQIAQEKAPREVAAHAQYLAIFAAAERARGEEGGSDDEPIALSQAFLKEFGDTALAAEVRMKLGQIYISREDYANAEYHLTTLAQVHPQSEYAEAALFLAGQSASRLMNAGAVDRALEIFGQVVKLGGKLRLYARQEQAIIESRLGHEKQAIAIYDLILTAQPPPDDELRFAALCGKGDNLLLVGKTDPAQVDASIRVYAQLAQAPGVTPRWRNQALYKRAKALEDQGKIAEALSGYYDVLAVNDDANRREYFWYYKAGFDGGRLLEQQGEWKSAIGLYEKMARLEGPRTAEARVRAKRLRSEYFIWDE